MVNRKRIYEVLANEGEGDRVAVAYNLVMVILVVLWMVPLWFKEENAAFVIIDRFCAAVFIVDYLLRWATADFKLKLGKASFALYPFTLMAILDLLSFAPTFIPANDSLKTIRILRVIGALRAFKLVRHSKAVRMLMDAARSQRMPLLITFGLAIAYVFVSATVMFNIEPDMFESFIDALYWSTISLTTIGYGDIHPDSETGRIVATISAMAGVAIIALPSGIIAAGVINELNKRDWDEIQARLARANRIGKANRADSMDEADDIGEPD